MRIITTLSVIFTALTLSAQQARILPQHDMAQWGIPAGNYSGITPLGGDRYALVSDKQEADGWTEVCIRFTPKGDIASMDFVATRFSPPEGPTPRDAEDLIATRQGTVYIAAESDQRIVEYDAKGLRTGRELAVPAWCNVKSIYGNYGFEALAYNAADGSFWTTTEHALRIDSEAPSTHDNPLPTRHRLLHFNASLRPTAVYAYRTDAPIVKGSTSAYAFGIPAMTCANSGKMLYVMEREIAVTPRYDGSFCRIAIFSVDPTKSTPITLDATTSLKDAADGNFITKTRLAEFTTNLRIAGRKTLANYEGMCLGPTLPDGRQTLLLVADSQNRAGNKLFRLKDYIRVVVLP